jgi:extracellular factor (EF) 3-hydroxypalmitic acid methyl ester biosynthesis protein
MEETDLREALVLGTTSQGLEVRGTPVRLARYGMVFEYYSLAGALQTSEVLSDLKIVLDNRTIYSGKGVVKSLIDAGPTFLCEAVLDDSWIEVEGVGQRPSEIEREFKVFLRTWQQNYKVLPEYKILAADMQTFLTDLRLWIEQVELGIRCSPSGDRLEMERQAGLELAVPVFPVLDTMFEKFEHLASRIPEELQPVHRCYIKRQIHPLVLCSPFAFRTVRKPLGYAGDYEVVNMILRDPHEGPSLFGKVLNRWFIKQPPAEAHRNRIRYLTQKLFEETLRIAAKGRRARVLNLGCGPAKEVQDFLIQQQISDRTHFTMLDFNDETLVHARSLLEDLKRRFGRSASFDFVKRSVGQVLKGRGKKVESSQASEYDLIYCAGLFDYLPDAICKQLISIFYDMVAPGGLVVATNVDSCNPIRNWLGDILEWHLVYRNARQFEALQPDRADLEQVKVISDSTGVNIFLEVRKALR